MTTDNKSSPWKQPPAVVRELIFDDEAVSRAAVIVEAAKIEKAAARKAAKAKKEAVTKAAKTALIVKAAADRAEARATGDDPAPGDYEFKLDDPPELSWAETKNNSDPIKGYANALVCVRVLGFDCRHDTFLDKYMVEGERLGPLSGELNDALVRRFREICVETFGGFEPGKDASFDALQRTCEQNGYDSLRVQLDTLKWDGTPRLNNWLTIYLGVQDSELHRAYGELVLMAAVRRVYDPGSVFQHVLILEGPEGTNKSSVVKVLACGQAEQRPLYFSDSPILHLNEREQQEKTKGVWFYEIGEMAGMTKADQFVVKRFITAEEERARAAYDRFLKSQPRIAIFIGTFNTDENTGGLIEYLNPGDRRRWWPVKVGKIGLTALQRDRWQLFAEAKEKARTYDGLTGEPTGWRSMRLDPALWDDAKIEQIEREKVDPFVDILAPLYTQAVRWQNAHPKGTREGFVVNELEVRVAARKVLELLPQGASTLEGGRRVPRALGKLGWAQVRGTGGASWYKRLRDESENQDESGGAPTTSTADEDFA